ncbi:hypothetical protein [Paenibacillus sp. 481]|uniref:hypothetical protein n=1 Tax=Paenibacillus sp. 481 TaxID=2835869 RepID=UPI001E468982|nr:hypothetical protein [Paenibacillus sp. 481]UHA71658.1 hypothetical protein KIK04_12665 [Paenibacillus sp. 481]
MSRIAKILVFFVVSLALFFYYINFSFSWPIHSDAASVVLMADAIKNGNYLLDGWYLSTGSYYTTEIVLYYIFICIMGISPLIIKYSSAIWLLGVVWCAVYLAGKTKEGFKYSNAIITFSLLAIPSLFISSTVLNGPMHISSMLYVFLAIIALEYLKSNVAKYSLFVILSVIVLIADPFVIWFFTIPIIITSCFLWYQDRQANHIYVVLMSIGAYIASKLVLYILNFTIPSVGVAKFVEFKDIVKNIVLAVEGILLLFDAIFFGGEVTSITTIKKGIHFIILVVGIYLIYSAVKNFKFTKSYDRLYVFLLVAILINLAEYLISNMPVDIGSTRYLFPMYIFLMVFIGKYGFSKIDFSNAKKRILLAVASVVIIGSYIITPLSVNQLYENKVTAFLVERNLKHGYGSFWSSLNLTVESKGLVNVYPVISNGGSIQAHKWLSYEEWYEQDVNFMVFSNDGWGDINKETIINSFGEPTEIHKIDQSEIYIWDKSISKQLK